MIVDIEIICNWCESKFNHRDDIMEIKVSDRNMKTCFIEGTGLQLTYPKIYHICKNCIEVESFDKFIGKAVRV